MTREDAEPRWLDPSSDAGEELRQLLLLTEEDNPTRRELSALDARMAPLLQPGPSSPAPGSDAVLAEGVKASGWLSKLLVGIGVAAVGAGGAWIAAANESPRLATDDFEQPVSVSARSVELPSVTDERTLSAPPVATSGRSEQPVRAKAAPDPADDMELLRKAQLALRAGNFGGALELTREHARSFPRSSLGQERELIAIEALQRSGRRSEASSRGKRFVERFPDSAHARRVRAILGLGADGSAP